LIIGKIVKSNSHIDYVCQIYSQNETAEPPSPADYRFGTFVRIGLSQPSQGYLVGVIYNTILMNPDFGSLGPRLSPPADLEIFSPDYLVEKATLVGIAAIGQMGKKGEIQQGVPPFAATVDAMVETMSEKEVAAFHHIGGRLRLHYAPLLMSQDNPLALNLLMDIIQRLEQQFPEEREQLRLLRTNLAWKSCVEPIG